MSALRIALVIPWFGPELKGGAEQQAWQIATRLARRGHEVEALTTCCRAFLEDWAVDHLPAGVTTEEGVTIRRFPVEPREREAFDRLNGTLLGIERSRLRPGVSPVPADEAATWTRENINSGALEAHLAAEAEGYDAILFIPYLYGPTLRGVPAVAAKAWIQPCLHDECYAYLPDTARAMHAARGILFNSEGERELAVRLFGPAMGSKGHVTGEGVEFASLEAHRDAPAPARVEGKRYVLFLGRRDAGKGVELLLEAHRALPDDARARLALVLAGPGNHDYGDEAANVFDLGLVSDPQRVALLRDCTALALPSPNESFSRVLYEAWHGGRPAIVRASCEATRLAVEACDGGWIAESAPEWTALLSKVARLAFHAPELRGPGERGRAYALEHADWERVMDRYERILSQGGEAAPSRAPARRPGHPEAIHQLAPNFGYGDAISNEMLAIRSALRAAGYRSDIVVRYVDPQLYHEVRIFGPDALQPDDGLIYHHSIGSEVTPTAIRHPGPKGLVYHNITPAEFFRPYRPDFVPILRGGREDLWAMAESFPVSAGDSRFNAGELARFGFREPGVLPLPVDASTWDTPPLAAWMEKLQDGRPNILFVGRVSPNKRQDRLVRAFTFLRKRMDARLIIAGSAHGGDPFADHVRALARATGFGDDIVIPGHSGHADLHAFYRCADLFWSFSEHEGFCVPLVEAMLFDVPVVALASSAVPETLEGAGITFDWADDDEDIAATVEAILRDPALRAKIVAGQRARRGAFAAPRSLASLAEFVERILAGEREPLPVRASA